MIMLIPLAKLPMGKVSGIIHVGAHAAEELEGYLMCDVRKVAWIEANPHLIEKVRDKVSGFNEMTIGHFAAGTDPGSMSLNLANNGQSSSLLELGTHRYEHPNIVYTGKVEVEVKRIDDWIVAEGLNRNDFNFMNLDIQGYELKALMGSTQQLKYVDFVYTEVNEAELYRDCALIGDIDSFLGEFGFIRLLTEMTMHGWGDAFYFKVST